MYSLSNIGKKEILDAIGEDSIKIVRGNRKSSKIFSIKESIKYVQIQYGFGRNMDDSLKKDERTGSLLQVPNFYWNVSFGCGNDQSHVKTSYKKYLTKSFQTDENTGNTFESTDPETGGFEHILYGNPQINIQPEQYIYLKDYVQPGSKQNQNDEDSSPYFESPDLLPISRAINTVVNEEEDQLPEIKLNDWKPEKMRELERKRKTERDSEWIQDNLDVENDQDEPKTEQDEPSSKFKVDPYCEEFVQKLRFFRFVLMWTGRWPFIETVKSDLIRYELKQRSRAHVIFMFAAVLHALVTTILFINTWKLITEEHDDNSIPDQVALLEFDKYWHFVFWTYLSALFVCTWNILFLTEYIHVFQNFLNRWNFAIANLRYDPKLIVPSKIINFWIFGFILYGTILTVCTFTKWIPAIRGFTGVLGSMFLRDYNFLRFNRYFFLLRFFGLIYHLYSIWSFKTTMLILVVYAKILENISKNWILRFAIRFDILKQKFPRKDFGFPKFQNIQLNVSFKKLLNELMTITTFARHTRVVYGTVLSLYMLIKGMEMMLLIYRLFHYIATPVQKFKSSEFDIGLSGDQLAYRDSIVQQVFSCFAVGLMVTVGWFVTSLNICSFGYTILSGLSVIRRRNLIFCRDAKERRFIQSVYAQFTSVSEYFPKATFVFNRRLIFNYFIWIAVFSLGLLSFSPFLLQKGVITVCKPPNEYGEVFCESYSRGRRSRPTAPPSKLPTTSEAIKNLTTSPTTTVPTSTTNIPTSTTNIPTTNNTMPPCIIATWTKRVNGTLIYQPSGVMKKLPYACRKTKHGRYDRIDRFPENLCITENTGRSLLESYSNTGIVYGCRSHKIFDDKDDCRNRYESGRQKFDTVLDIVTSLNSSTDLRICSKCFLLTDERSLKYCNMLSSWHAKRSCKGTKVLKHAANESYPPSKVVCTPSFNKFSTCPIDPDWYSEHGGIGTDQYISFRILDTLTNNEIYPYIQNTNGNWKFTPCWEYHQYNSQPFNWINKHDVQILNINKNISNLISLHPLSTTQSTFYNIHSNEIFLQEKDDCNNFPFADALNQIAIVLNLQDGSKPYKVVCCWDYKHEKIKNSTKVCNLKNKRHALNQCQQPFKREYHLKHDAQNCANILNKNDCNPQISC